VKKLLRNNALWFYFALLGAFVLLLNHCNRSTPTTSTVRNDFKQIVEREFGREHKYFISSIKHGEGDSENVDMHIQFNVLASTSHASTHKLLSTNHRPRNEVGPFEMRILYQRYQKPDWEPTKHSITIIPSANQAP
jgi:hypothetical protein